jgi:hypothetical protein
MSVVRITLKPLAHSVDIVEFPNDTEGGTYISINHWQFEG